MFVNFIVITLGLMVPTAFVLAGMIFAIGAIILLVGTMALRSFVYDKNGNVIEKIRIFPSILIIIGILLMGDALYYTSSSDACKSYDSEVTAYSPEFEGGSMTFKGKPVICKNNDNTYYIVGD